MAVEAGAVAVLTARQARLLPAALPIIFVLKDDANRSECEPQAQILRDALDEDFEKLRKEYGHREGG